MARKEQARVAAAEAVEARARVLELFPLELPPEVLTDARPSAVLRAERAVAPFRGRRGVFTDLSGEENQGALDELLDWCLTGTQQLCLLSGPPLVGKTRLTMRLAELLPPDWTAGRLRPHAGKQAYAAIRACPGPHLVVVDLPRWQADQRAFLDAVVDASDTRVRVIVVSRTPGLPEVFKADLSPNTTRWEVSLAARVHLMPEGEAGDLARWYGEAVTAFAQATGRGPRVVPSRGPQTGTPIGGVQARALVEVLGDGAPGDGPVTASAHTEVAAALAAHEEAFWPAVSGTSPVGQELRRECVAAVLLFRPDGREETVRVLRRLPDLSGALGERVRALASWVERLYPGATDGSVAAPEPELLAHVLTVPVLARASPQTRAGLFGALGPRQLAEVVGFLLTAAPDFPEAVPLIEEAIRLNGAEPSVSTLYVGLFTVSVSRRTDEILTELITNASLSRAQVDGLKSVLLPVEAYPRTWVALQERVVRLARASDDPAALAASLNNLGNRLSEVGRPEDALAPTEEALTIHRSLAKTNPTAHLPDLATSLNDLGFFLSAVGRREDALAPTEEAITIRRSLAETKPAIYLPDLAMSLHNFGADLSAVGRREDALAPTEEAVTLYRQLAETNPAAHGERLRMAEQNLRDLLRVLGVESDDVMPDLRAHPLETGGQTTQTAGTPLAEDG
ncbi:MAG: tetratricopeptide repeat protein [Kineosporiaceae bacterium]